MNNDEEKKGWGDWEQNWGSWERQIRRTREIHTPTREHFPSGFPDKLPLPDADIIQIPYGLQQSQIVEFTTTNGIRRRAVYIGTHKGTGKLLLRSLEQWFLMPPDNII